MSSPPLPVASAEDLAAALRQLDDPNARDDAISHLLGAGDDGLDALFEAFPGHLVVDRYGVEPNHLPVSQHSGVLAAVVRFGRLAVPRLEALLEHLSPEFRYYAALCFDQVRSPNSLGRIAGRLFDAEALVRDAAAFALRSYQDDPNFSEVVQVLRNGLAADRPSTRRVAAEMLGRLHAVGAVADLVELMQLPAGPLVEAARRALVEISYQEYAEPWMWLRWYESNRGNPRVAWLVDALQSDRRALRLGALRELRSITDLDHGYDPDAPAPERRAAVERWTAWLATHRRHD